MITELLVAGMIVLNALSIYLAWRFSPVYLIVVLVLALFLSTVFAAHIIVVFGVLVSMSTIFFVPMFFVTNVFNEIYGKRRAEYIVQVGLFGLVVVLVTLSVVLQIQPSQETTHVYDALRVLFNINLFTTLGSLIGYMIAQWVNRTIYSVIKKRTGDKKLWLRYNVSMIVAFAVDSMIFYPLAFYSVIDFKPLLVVMLTGWLAKSLVAVFTTPMMYIIKRASTKDILLLSNK